MNAATLAKLEKQIPAKAVRALNAASRRAEASGLPRVLAIDGGLYRVHPDGRRELLETLPPPMKVRVGARYTRS